MRLGKELYQKYLNSDWWKIKRKQVGEKFCFVCGARQNLHIHHLTYARIFREKNKDLKWLCKEHHEGFHKFTGRLKLKALRSYKRFILTGIDERKDRKSHMFNRKAFYRNSQSSETAAILRRKQDGSKLLKFLN